MTTTVEKTTTATERIVFPGVIFTVLVSAASTENRISILEMECIPGFEPPRHVHTIEDEIFMIKEGNVTFFRGDDIIQAGPGDTVVLHKNVPHHFAVTSERVKGIMIATPGNLENFFRARNIEHEGNEVPAPTRPTMEEIIQLGQLAESFGMNFM